MSELPPSDAPLLPESVSEPSSAALPQPSGSSVASHGHSTLAASSVDKGSGNSPVCQFDPASGVIGKVLLESRSFVNKCAGIEFPCKVGIMAEIFDNKPLDALPKVPVSPPGPVQVEAQDLDQAKVEIAKPSRDAIFGSIAIAGLGKRFSLTKQADRHFVATF